MWRICAWAGPIYLVGTLVSWAAIAGFLPPPREYWNAEEVYSFFTDNNMRIRVGMALILVFAPLYYVWSSVLSRIMARAEGQDGVLSSIELLGGFGTTLVTFGSVAGWLSAAFDTELKTPQDIKTITDYAWFWFNATAAVTVTQFVAVGSAFLIDRRAQPLFPRWMCWFSFAMAVTLVLALFTPFFHQGPFAWHGLLTYYVGLGGYFAWIICTCYFAFKAIAALEKEALA
ncbi:hypothetical protein [Oleomonas cavernae]|uniref:hypothetical protein n=1 Tax=Oleomonas cavernae TaxID=2320859 RepID=UPI001314171A|nr:hypothetical protein [Oleomonas cavernae]